MVRNWTPKYAHVVLLGSVSWNYGPWKQVIICWTNELFSLSLDFFACFLDQGGSPSRLRLTPTRNLWGHRSFFRYTGMTESGLIYGTYKFFQVQSLSCASITVMFGMRAQVVRCMLVIQLYKETTRQDGMLMWLRRVDMHALSNDPGFLEMWTKQGHDKQCMILLARAGTWMFA
jgi:hypothetical protein